MDNHGNYADKLDQIVAIYNDITKSGYHITPVVYNLSTLINKFSTLLQSYKTINENIDAVAISKPEFGSNRNELIRLMSDREKVESDMKTILSQVDTIENNILTESSINNTFDMGGKQVFVNNSVNAFPDCVPVNKLDIPNNLYLIKDAELDNYNVLISDFLKIAKKVYSELNVSALGDKYSDVVSNIGMLIKSTETILNTTADLIDKKDYYNKTYETIRETDPQYSDYENYPAEYEEAKSIIIDIYGMNCNKFDEIMNIIHQ